MATTDDTVSEYCKMAFVHHAFDEFGIETAWVIPMGDGYRLDNILFYAKEYACGDVIAGSLENGMLHARQLLSPSGHSTIRVLCKDIVTVEQTRSALKSLGCDSELSNLEKLFAVDVPVLVDYGIVREFLERGKHIGAWDFEEACLSSEHRERLK